MAGKKRKVARKKKHVRSDLITEQELRGMFVSDRSVRPSARASKAASQTEQHTPAPHLRHRWSITLTVSVFVVITLGFITLLFLQQLHIQALLVEQQNLTARVSELEAQNAFYRKAYAVTLDDIRVLSGIYGGEEQYAQRARELRGEEISTFDNTTGSTQQYTIRNPELWREYQRQGLVNADCLPTVDIVTATDEVLVTFTIDGNASLYIDGNSLPGYKLNQSLSLVMPDGEHELSLLSKGGDVHFSAVSFDTVTYPMDSVVADLGTGLQAFDCLDATKNSALTEPGTLRLRILKG